MKQKPNQAYSIFITGLPQFIYSIGIYGFLPENAYLIKLTSDANRLGSRPSSKSDLLFKLICTNLKIKSKCLELDYLGDLAMQDGDIIDIQLSKRLCVKVKDLTILAAQSEYVNFTRPHILSFKIQSLKLRVDLICKVLTPARARKFYTLAPKSKRGIFLKEKTLNWPVVDKFSEDCFHILRKCNEIKFLETLWSNFRDLEVLIVYPLAPHFGGNDIINEHIMSGATLHAKKFNLSAIIVKNHPSDDTNYESLMKGHDFQIIFLYQELERTVPVEILINAFKSVSFYGVESTTFLSLQHRVREESHLIELASSRDSKYQKYILGEIRNLYPHSKSLI